MQPRLSRRELLEKCVAMGVVSSAAGLAPEGLADAWALNESGSRAPTPMAELGPFYKRLAPLTHNLRAAGDPGMPLVVTGAVFSSRGEALPDAKLEIWQTNHGGIYDIEGYRYRARMNASPKGEYEFSSVIPGHYPARVCQHVHYLVTAPGHQSLTTQLYFATDPVFEGDPDKNYVRDPLITSRELVRPVTLVGDPQQMYASVRFELVLEPR